jgi:hypothetical protein
MTIQVSKAGRATMSPPVAKSTVTVVCEMFRLGSRLTWWEIVAAYALPFFLSQATIFQDLFLWNLTCQVGLFLAVVQLPLLITGRMSYVDIGWPSGLVVLGANCIYYGNGWMYRKSVTPY